MSTSDPSRSYHHGDLRNAIKAAALDLIAEQGLERFSLRAASRRVGVSPAAAYRHFPSKEALVVELAAEATSKLAEAMERRFRAASADGEGDPLFEKLIALGEGYILFALEHRRLFHLLLGTRRGCEELAPEVRPGQPLPERDPYGMLLAALAGLRDQGRLNEPDIIRASLAAWSAVHGLATLLVDGVLRLEEAGLALDEAIRVVVRGVAEGLLRPACPGQAPGLQRHPAPTGPGEQAVAADATRSPSPEEA